MDGDALPALGPYVGRSAELSRFERNLGDAQKVIVGISGEYGLGKTTLLRRFQQTAAVSGLITASTDATGKGIPAMLGSLAAQLEQRGRPLRSFSERYRVYRQRMNELEADPQAPKGLAAFAAGTLAKGGVRAARHLPVAGLAFELVSEDGAASAARELTTYVAGKIGNQDEVELVLEPVPTLTKRFLEDLGEVAHRQRVGLFLDADDTSHRDVEAWLLDVVRERYAKLPAAVVATVATSRELDRGGWVEFEALVDRITLGPLTEEEARLYLEQAGVTNEAVVAEILRRSGRIPLSLALLAAQRPETPDQVGDPNGTAVDGFLSSVSEPARRRLAVDGSVPRFVNRDVLGVVFGRDDVLDDFVWLTELPFLKDTEQGWVYSEPVRDQLLQRSRRDAPQSWTQLHRTLAEYYERLASELAPDETEQALDTEWQRYELEATYHRLCSGRRAALRRVLNGFMSAFAADRRFARRYGAAIQQAGSDTADESLIELGDLLSRGTAAIDSPESAEAIEMFERLLDSSELEDAWRAKALDWRGFLTTVQGAFEAALSDFDAALELEPDSVEYLLDRARALQRLGRYDESLRDLDKAAAMEADNPLVLMLRAETHQLADRLDEAREDIERVLELQPKNAAAWMLRADMLQLTGDLDEALTSLDRALEVEPENANAWAAHGRVQQARGRLDDALRDLDAAVERAPENYGVLSLRAHLLGRSGRFEQAARAIRELIELAPEFLKEYGAIASQLPRGELQRRSALFASLAGFEGPEAARQMESFMEGPEGVVRVLEADLAVLEAQAHLQAEDVRAAIAEYGRAIERDPGRAGLWVARAGLLMRAENPDEALADVERAIELVPENYSFLAARYTILAQKGDHERAAADMRTIADHADEYVHQLAATARLAGVALPTLAAAAGPPSLPSAAGQSWLELAVANPDAAVRAVRVAADAVEAVSLMARGDLEGARSRYRHALELDPDQSVVWTAKAELELQLGNLEEARADFDRAVETGPDNPQAWRNRARFRLSQQSLDDALMDIDRAIELAPTDYTLISVRALIFQASGALAGFAECARILAEHAEEYVDQVAAGARMAPAGAPASASLDGVFGTGDAAATQLGLFLEDREAAIRQVRAEAPMAEALLLASMKDAEGAIAAWTRALDLGGPSVEWLLARGELRRLAGHLDEALADCEGAIELDDGSAEAHGSRGQVLRALERSDEALAELDRALELDDSLSWAYLERGELHRLGGRFEPALADFDRMVELNPDSAIAHGSRGQVLRALDRPHEALAALDRALQLDDTLSWVRVERGELYLEVRRWTDAEAEFAHLLAANPGSLGPLVGHGRALHGLCRFDEALVDLDRAIDLAPDIAFCYGIRGEIRYLRRDTDGALDDFARAAELAPDWSEVQSRLSETLQLAGRTEEALTAIETALEPSPDDAWMRYVRALAHGSLSNLDASRGDLDGAIATAEQLARDGSDRPRQLLNAAVFRLARRAPGDEDEAARLFDEVAPIDALHRWEAIRDLETLAHLRGSPSAETIAATLASELTHGAPA